MSKSKILIFSLPFLFSFLAYSVHAAGIELGRDGFLEKVEPALEVINLVMAIMILFISLAGIKKAGGIVRQAWILVVIATGFFALLEITGALKAFGVFQYHGAGDLIEFFMAGTLLLAVRQLKKLF